MTTSLIREAAYAVDNTELDLKGLSEAQSTEFIVSSFKEQRELSSMIRITLIIGAGKGKRSRYNEEMGKWVVAALKSIGYKEEKEADSMEITGTYKYQHDTGKNLKLIHVHPKATVKEASDGDGAGVDGDNREKGVYVVEEELLKEVGVQRYEWICLSSKPEDFQKIVTNMLICWTQKKRCKELVQSFIQKLEKVEQKLSLLKVLTPAEEKIYTNLDTISLEQKQKLLSKEMKTQVNKQRLSQKEKQALIEKLKQAMEGKEDKTGKAVERLKFIESIVPKKAIELCPFFEAGKIKELVTEQVSLGRVSSKLEEKAGTKGLWSSKLSSEEVKLLKRKKAVDEELEEVINKDRCYFETEEELLERRNEFVGKLKPAVKKKLEKKEPKRSSGNNGWNTVQVNSKKKGPDFAKALKRKPNTGAFNALMD